MNRSDWLTDELIQAAFERRARRAAPGNLRETILTLTAASRQRSPWHLQFRSTLSTPVFRQASLNRVAAAAVIGVIAVGAGLFVTRPGEPAVGGPSPTPNATFSPSPPASPSAGPSVAVGSLRAPAWIATGAMAKPRAAHKATLLPDGRVLVVDDEMRDPISPPSPELYDPGTGTWASTGSMVAPRFNYSATFLADGKVLVAGGTLNTGALASAELYDPISGTWSATGSMVAPYYFHTATRLLDGKVLVAGVISADGRPSAELYDPVSGTWSATGAMVTPREGHTATLLPDGNVLVAGGIGAIGVTSAELYDPASGTWTATGAMATARSSHTATLLPNGKVLVAGGHILGSRELCSGSSFDCINPLASAELYDPQSGAWSATQGMVAPRASHTATLLPDGGVLVAGGMTSALTSASGGHDPLASAELYDPASGTWSATASMVDSRSGSTATLLPDRRVLVAGGGGNTGVLASAELYDPGSGN